MLLTKCFRTQSPGFVYKIILYVVSFLCEATVKVGLDPSFQVAQLKQCMWAIKEQLDATILFLYKRNIASRQFFSRLRPCFELLMSVVLEVTVKNLILITHEQKVSQIWIFLVEHFVFNLRFFFFKTNAHLVFFFRKKKMLSFSFFFLLPKHSSKRFVFVFEQSTVWISIW